MTDTQRTPVLTGKVAVVTGGGSGLGAAMARVFAGAGMNVAILDIDAATAEQTAKDIADEFPVRTMSARVDVGDADALAEAARQVETALGGCDVLCANVGVQQFGAVDRLTDEDWQWVLDVNVLGTVRTVRAFLPLIRSRTGWRRVVLTSSSSALVPGVRLGAYITSKFAVTGFGETLRMELADEGIGVSVLFPAGMTSRHLESSALARPADIGEWVLRREDIDAMMASRSVDTASHVATPEHAVRNLLAELDADSPYIITHGAYRAEYRQRHAALESAFDRMERPATDTDTDTESGTDTDRPVAPPATPAPSVQALWDIEQIKQLKARYFRCIDLKDWDTFRDLFTDDCRHYLPIDGDDRFQTNEEYFATTVPRLVNGVTTHHGHMPEITLLSDTEAEGIWSMFDYVQLESPDHSPDHRTSIQGYGHYYETYRKCPDGRWRISSKRNDRQRIDQVPWTVRPDAAPSS